MSGAPGVPEGEPGSVAAATDVGAGAAARVAPTAETPAAEVAAAETSGAPAAGAQVVGLLDAVAGRLRAARRVLVSCHLRPDGDAMGSMCALGALLRDAGREVVLFNPDPVPRALSWIPGADGVLQRLPADARFDLTLVVDCGDEKLLGRSFPPREVTGPLIVLDHHLQSRPFGDLYVCDPAAASVGVLVARLADRLGWPLSPAAATAVYASLVADTGSFRYANTDAESFRLAGRLVDLGVDPWHVARHLGEEHPLARHRLLAAALGTLTLELEGKVAIMTVTEDLVRAAGARWEHSEGLVNYARGIQGVELGVLLAPGPQGGSRASLRSKGRIDCGAVCAPFGGGGHVGAAGCSFRGDMATARGALLAALAPHVAALAPRELPGAAASHPGGGSAAPPERRPGEGES